MSGIQHFCYCKRQWALINIEQVWEDDARTTSGSIFHTKSDDPLKTEARGDTISSRAIPASSSTLGLSGRCDVVEFIRDPNGVEIGTRSGTYSIVPIEYKVGGRKSKHCDALQLCAEAMALEETFGCSIRQAYLFYGSERRRLEVIIDDDLRVETTKLAEEMHEMFRASFVPKPMNDKRCERCSLIDLCLPTAVKKKDVTRYIEKMRYKDEEAP